MSALFGKRDYGKTIEAYVRKGDFESALRVAIEAGDRLYEDGDKEKSLSMYLNLLKLYDAQNVPERNLYEKLYEKIIPLLFELNREEEAVNFSLLLVGEKVALNKKDEARGILDELISGYKENKNVILKEVEFDISNGDLEKALSVLKNAISNGRAEPKFIELAGEILMKLHKFKEAYDYYNALISIDPDNVLAKKRLSEIQASVKLDNTPKVEEETEENLGKKVLTPPLSAKSPKLSGETKNVPQTFEKKVIKVKESEDSNVPEKEQLIENKRENLKQTENMPAKEPVKTEENYVQLTVFKDPVYTEAIKKILTDKEEGFEKLLSLARRYETLNYIEAEYLYHKLLLIHPDRKDIYDDLVRVYEKNNRKEDEMFALRLIADNCPGNSKLVALRKLETMSKGNANIGKEIFETSLENLDKETAVEYFVKLKDKPGLLTELAQKIYPIVKDDQRLLEVITEEIRNKAGESKIAFKYYYTLGTMYFNMGSQPEGLKWLMRAHSISSLPLDDCIKIAEYIKGLPLDGERGIIANALNGYINTVTDKNKKDYIYKLMLSLKPLNSLYMKDYIAFLEQEEKFKEMSVLLKKLVKKMDINSASFVSDKILKVAEYFGDEELAETAELLEVADNTEGAGKVYELLLKRNPDNSVARVKLLYMHLEEEDTKFIVSFFKKYDASHKYADIVNPVIIKLEGKRTSSPLDYHLHFVLGFVYFLVERFEEAIASFQFVARSHRSEPLMHFFIGISFRKIGLPDFAFKQYEMVTASTDALPELKEDSYYRMAVLKKNSGDVKAAISFAEKALEINPKNSAVRKLMEILPGEESKITKLEGD